MVKIGEREVAVTDAVLMGTGVLMLVDGFLPWYGVDFGPFGGVNIKGFSSGLLAWLPIVLVIVVGAAVAGRVFAGQTLPANSSIGPAGLLLAAAGLATVLVLLKFIVDSSYTKFGLFAGLVIAAVQTAYAYRAFRASGEALPAFGRGASSPPSS